MLVTLITAVHLHYRMPPGADRAILMALILGLVTYYLHGGLNNPPEYRQSVGTVLGIHSDDRAIGSEVSEGHKDLI